MELPLPFSSRGTVEYCRRLLNPGYISWGHQLVTLKISPFGICLTLRIVYVLFFCYQTSKSFKHKFGNDLGPLAYVLIFPFRALRVLRSANVILSEDTRHSGRLLQYYDIKTPLVSSSMVRIVIALLLNLQCASMILIVCFRCSAELSQIQRITERADSFEEIERG